MIILVPNYQTYNCYISRSHSPSWCHCLWCHEGCKHPPPAHDIEMSDEIIAAWNMVHIWSYQKNPQRKGRKRTCHNGLWFLVDQLNWQHNNNWDKHKGIALPKFWTHSVTRNYVSTLVYGPLPLMMAAPEGYNPLNLRRLMASKIRENNCVQDLPDFFFLNVLFRCEYAHCTYCLQCNLFWSDVQTILARCNSCMHVPMSDAHLYRHIWAAFNISVWF